MESFTKNQIAFDKLFLHPAIVMIGRWSYLLNPKNSLPLSHQEKQGGPIFGHSLIPSLCKITIVIQNTELVCSLAKSKKGIRIEIELNQPS
jgi:hypothetical protein